MNKRGYSLLNFTLICFFAVFLLVSETPAQTSQAGLFKNFSWRSIGPANMTGRVSDVEALDSNFRVVLVASASGGVWKSENAGITWEPIFNNYGTGSIGDIAFFQKNPNIIWVGTGEANNRNSSGWGDGIYKSEDGGETFQNMGLEDTHQIARVITHPDDKNTVYAAAIGHLWGYSGERGIFKTTDGGKTWEKLLNGLPDDGKTGCTDLVINPNDPDVLYAAMYHRIRKAWTFQSGGPEGGIYKTTDAGKTWTKLTSGLPQGETGRIGIDIYRKNPDILMANIETDENIPDDKNIPGPGVYRSEDGGENWEYQYRHISRPFYFGQIRIDPNDSQKVYLLYRSFEISSDGGKTFVRGFRSVYGDPHAMWIDPNDNGVIYFGDDGGGHLSQDNGRTFMKFDNIAIGQYYAIGVDMRDPYWIYGGLQDQNVWGGPSNSRDRYGILNDHNFNVSGGDGFHAQVDPEDWRTVYSVAHVGYAGRTNVETRERKFITPTPETILNFSDYAAADYKEEPIKYTINPGEEWLWRDMPSRSIEGNILPPHFRFNWSSPLVISPNNSRTIYFGSNHLFKSTDRGDTWTIISPDLTTNDPKKRNPNGDGGLTVDVTGAENHCTIITISESPLNSEVIWAGTDDGNVQVTTNGGEKWSNVRDNIPGIPEEIWVSRVEASHFSEGTAYVSFDGHRSDNFTPYVFKTSDFGKTWSNIAGDLPDGNSVYVVKEDFRNNYLLFVGTEFGCFATIDGGEKWFRLNNDLPTVAVHDLVIHPRDADVVAGTHGRSIYILDNITALQQLNDAVLDSELFVFESRIATKWQNISRGGSRGNFLFRGQNPPRGAEISFYLKADPEEKVLIEITDLTEKYKFSKKVSGEAGINKFQWNLFFPVSDKDKDNFINDISSVIAKLQEKVRNPDKLEQLIMIKEKLGKAINVSELNRLRNSVISGFRHYAEGKPLFHKPLTRIEAPSGRYKVTITAFGKTVSDILTVRDDPILK